MAKELNLNFKAYNSCENTLYKALSFCSDKTFSSKSLFSDVKSSNPAHQKIKSNLRSTAQKLFLYDILTSNNQNQRIKEDATCLLNELMGAKTEYDREDVMNNIDMFSERYKRDLKKF